MGKQVFFVLVSSVYIYSFPFDRNIYNHYCLHFFQTFFYPSYYLHSGLGNCCEDCSVHSRMFSRTPSLCHLDYQCSPCELQQRKYPQTLPNSPRNATLVGKKNTIPHCCLVGIGLQPQLLGRQRQEDLTYKVCLCNRVQRQPRQLSEILPQNIKEKIGRSITQCQSTCLAPVSY